MICQWQKRSSTRYYNQMPYTIYPGNGCEECANSSCRFELFSMFRVIFAKTNLNRVKMAKLVITRSNEWINKGRILVIYLDRKKIGTISSGETKIFQISEGSHTLAAKMSWWSSPRMTFSLQDEEQKKLEVSGFKNVEYYLALSVVLIAIIAFSKEINLVAFAVWLLFPIVLAPFYYLTIGRSSYLKLKEVH